MKQGYGKKRKLKTSIGDHPKRSRPTNKSKRRDYKPYHRQGK